MSEFLNNPAVLISIVALIGAITNFINNLSKNAELLHLSRMSAKHEEQLNGSFEPRVKAVVDPVITGAANRVAQSASDVPQVK